MSLKTILEHSVLSKLTYAAIASLMLGGGTVVLSNQSRIAVLEDSRHVEQDRLTRIEDQIEHVNDKLDIIVQQGVTAAAKPSR